MKKILHETKGTCSRAIHIELDGQVVRSVEFVGGCTGNLRAIASLAAGHSAQDLIKLFEGIQCQNGTSCPDQLAQALRKAARPGRSSSKKSRTRRAT